jgi:type III pantothenate kinase
VELVRPRSPIGKNTVEALQSGALYGFAGQVDGLVDRITEELGEVTAVVATGGLAPIVVPESRRITHHEPELTLIGLRLVYEKNTDSI